MAQQQLPWQWLDLCRDIAHTSNQNPCKSQNTIQCSKNSDKIPNHLLISNLKKYHACKKGMQIVKDSTSARAEVQKHNAEEFPRFWKTPSTTHYRQGGIQCSGEDTLSVKAKISHPCCYPIPKNTEEWREEKGLVPSTLTERISELLTVRCRWSCRGGEPVLTPLWS